MSDIVERLRQRYSELEINERSLAWQAADEIARLRAALGPSAPKAWAHLYDEVERLKSELARIRGLPRLAALADEIARLRTALSAIGNNASETDNPREYARRILEQK